MTGHCDESLLQMCAEGTLVPAEQAVVEAHLAGCPACRRTLGAYKALMWDLEHPAPVPAPPELQAVSDRLMAAWEAEAAGRLPPGWVRAGLAWTRTTPVVAPVVDGLGQGLSKAGRGLPRAAWAGLKWLVRRGGDRR